MEAPIAPTRLRFVNTPGALEAARAQLLAMLKPHRLSETCLYRIETVLEEWLTNVVRHGFQGSPEAAVDIDVGVGEDHVSLRFRDAGPAFDPLGAESPEPWGDLEHAKVGGLGLEMIRNATQALYYERVQGHNLLQATLAR